MTAYLCEYAVVGDPGRGEVAASVLIEVDGERVAAVTPGADALPGAVRLSGVTIPSLANVHSHAFHRALRGRSEQRTGDFWSWREQMYGVAETLDPDSYHELARALYAEMALAGISSVGEFHYLHHGRGGRPYADPNAMGAALVEAASEAGVRITLLDTAYLHGGFGHPLEGTQLRFGDKSAESWATRAGLRPSVAHCRLGAAIHSVRAVEPDEAAVVASWAASRAMPLHVHLSEQIAENDGCNLAYGRSPALVLRDAGALGPATTAVHATHVSEEDITALGAFTVAIAMCPTTERDLADGIGSARHLAAAGSPICVGSDSHAVVDLFEEARAIELDERLATHRRAIFDPAELLDAATQSGHRAIGWPDAGRIEVGALADFCTVSLDSVRLAGTARDSIVPAMVFVATAADVSDLVVGGRRIVESGRHLLVDEPARAMANVLEALRAGGQS